MRIVLREMDSGVTKGIAVADMAEARAAAEEWIEDGDYDTSNGTTWVDVVIEDEDGEELDSVTVTLEPPEPACSEDEHDWQSPHEIVGGIESNPGVWGKGGGVIIHEVCLHCGCARITDTWAQRMDTGEQGLRSVRYDDDMYAEAVEDYRNR